MTFSVALITISAISDLKKDADSAVNKFVSLLRTNNDLKLAEKIGEEFENIYNEKNNIKIVEVESARKLAENIKKEIIKIFGKATGKDIILEEKIDEDLIGGFKVRMDDILLDSTIKSRLVSLKNKLK